MKTTYPLLALLILFGLTSCLKDDAEVIHISYTDSEYAVISAALDLPNPTFNFAGISSFGDVIIDFIDEPGALSFQSGVNHRATLGRVLFYDTRLSQNDQVSCASCHDQKKGFADDQAFSTGFAGELTKRNSLALNNINSYSSQRFFWDERANSVEEQTQMTIEDHIEMGMDLDLLPAKLEKEEYYRILFEKAFGPIEPITADHVSAALAEFVRRIVSNDSPFDRAIRENGFFTGQNLPSLTAQENRGLQLFNENCSKCHGLTNGFSGPLTNMANNGLDQEYVDQGLGALTGQATDNGIFKVPILKNVALSAPYMHDGRFATLEEVVDHYSEGVQSHPNLHELLRSASGDPQRLDLSADDRAALVAFLETLTDVEFTLAEYYADPFK